MTNHLASCWALALLLLTTGVAPAQTVADGWDALWQNQFEAAITSFEAAGSDDTSALQGRLLAELALGRTPEAARTLQQYLDDLPRDTADFELITHAIWNLDLEDRELAGQLAERLESLGDDPDLDPIDRRQALALQQRLFMAAGETGEVEKLTRKLNRITDWGILGPFDNTSGSGHGREFVRQTAFDPLERYDGKFGQPVKWFQPDLKALDGSVSPSKHFEQDQYTTSYVRTAVEIPRAGEYLLSLGFQGDVQILLNDKVLADADSEIAGPERLHWRVALPRGWNRLAVKVSHREDGDALTVSLSNLDGSAIDDLEVSVTKNGLAVMDEIQATPMTGERFQAVIDNAQQQPDDPRLALWQLTLSRRTLAPDALLAFCDDLAHRFEDQAILQLAVADARYQAGQRSRYEQRMSQLAEAAPELATPHLYLGYEDLKRKYNTRAINRAKSVLERAKNCPRAHRLKLRGYRQERRWQDLKTGAENAMKRLPRESFPYFYLAEWAKEMGDGRAAKKYREQAVERMSPSAANFQRLRASLDKDDFSDAKDLARKLTEVAPDAMLPWSLYIRALIHDGKVKDAAGQLDRLLANFPLNVEFLSLKALTILRGVDFDLEAFWRENPALLDALRKNRYLRNERQVERERKRALATMASARERAAAEILATALLVAPGNLALRDQIRSWRGQEPYREMFEDLEAEDIEAMRVEPGDHAGFSAVMLKKLDRTLVFDGQASLHDQTRVVQILDQDGVEEWEVLDLGSGRRRELTFVEYEVIKPDGAVEQGELLWGKIMFKGLEPGDIVHLRYQVPSIVTGRLVGNLWDQQLFASAQWPTREAVYELITPPDLAIEHRTWHDPAATSGPAPQPTGINVAEGLQGKRWRYRDLPAFSHEPGASDPRYYLPWVDVSTLDDWAAVARWFHDLANGQAEPDAEIRRKAAELTADLDTPEAQLAAIYRFVANEITYEAIPLYQSAYIPRRASVVLRDGFGDCKDKSCLLIALARAAGLEDLEFVLVTPNAPSRPGIMPSPRFNHAIVCRQVGLDRYQWLDPTLRMSEPGQVPRYLNNVPALICSRFGGELVTIVDAADAGHPTTIAAKLAIDDQGHATVAREVIVSQIDRVVGLRRTLNGMDEDGLKSHLVRALATDHPGAHVTERALTGLTPGVDTVGIRERFEVPELAQLQSGFLSLGVPWRTQLRDWSGMLVADESRESPINLRLLNVDEIETIDIALPDGQRLVALPDGVDLTSGACHFEISFERLEGGLRVQRRLILAGNVVALDAYQEFKEFLDQVRRSMQRTLNLRTA